LISFVFSGQTICLKLSPNLRKKAKVKFFSKTNKQTKELLFWFEKIRKGVEVTSAYDRELDKLTHELSRTVTINSMHDILLNQTTNIDNW